MSQLDLFAEPVAETVEADDFPAHGVPFDHVAWSQAQNPTPTRCDRCMNWTRTLENHWGECSARKSYEHEYGGEGCQLFETPPAPGFTQDELSALRVARLVSAVRAIGDEEMYAARDAIKKWRVEAKSSPVFEFLHGKLNYARGLLQAVTL